MFAANHLGNNALPTAIIGGSLVVAVAVAFGGGGVDEKRVLDPLLIAQATTVLALLVGLLMRLCPIPTAKLAVQMDVKNYPRNKVFWHRIGAHFIATGAAGCVLFFLNNDKTSDGASNNRRAAIGVAALVWVVELTASTINDEPAQAGYDAAGNNVWIVIHAILAYLCLKESDEAYSYTDKILQAVGVVTAVTSLALVVRPIQGLALYGMKSEKISLDNAFLAQLMGSCMVSGGLSMILLPSRLVSTTQAFGSIWIPTTLVLLVSIAKTPNQQEEKTENPPPRPLYTNVYYCTSMLVSMMVVITLVLTGQSASELVGHSATVE